MAEAADGGTGDEHGLARQIAALAVPVVEDVPSLDLHTPIAQHATECAEEAEARGGELARAQK